MNVKAKTAALPILLSLMGSALLISNARAQAKNERVTIISMVDIIPDYAKPQSEENGARIIRAQTSATQQDPGLISYNVYQREGGSNHFAIVETWRDSKAYETHEGVAHTLTFRKDIQPFLGGPLDQRAHHPFR